MFFNIQIDLLILKTYYGQFTLTTKKSLHIIFKVVINYNYSVTCAKCGFSELRVTLVVCLSVDS